MTFIKWFSSHHLCAFSNQHETTKAVCHSFSYLFIKLFKVCLIQITADLNTDPSETILRPLQFVTGASQAAAGLDGVSQASNPFCLRTSFSSAYRLKCDLLYEYYSLQSFLHGDNPSMTKADS